jgi:hypothetical protein
MIGWYSNKIVIIPIKQKNQTYLSQKLILGN